MWGLKFILLHSGKTPVDLGNVWKTWWYKNNLYLCGHYSQFLSIRWIFEPNEKVLYRGVGMGSWWRVCGGSFAFGFYSHRNVKGILTSASYQPCWLSCEFWEVGNQASKVLPAIGRCPCPPAVILGGFMDGCMPLCSICHFSLHQKAGSPRS